MPALGHVLVSSTSDVFAVSLTSLRLNSPATPLEIRISTAEMIVMFFKLEIIRLTQCFRSLPAQLIQELAVERFMYKIT